jgi:hypothetical protein
MLSTKFQFIPESDLRGEDFLEINQSETRMACGGLFFSLGIPVSSINITDRHNITEILLKVALNTLTLILLCVFFIVDK